MATSKRHSCSFDRRILAVASFVVFAALLYWEYGMTRTDGKNHAEIDTPGCRLSAPDQFGWMLRYLYYRDTWQNETLCQEPDTPVTFVRYDVPVLDEALLQRRFGVSTEDVRCQYAPLMRNMTAAIPDKSVVYGSPRTVVFGDSIADEYIFLWCYTSGGLLFDQHYFLPKKRNVKTDLKRSLSNEQIGVVIIGIDSVSRLNSIRQLPRTRKFMKELGAFEMLGFNKVGENAMPNLIPMLTGSSFDVVRTRYRNRSFDGLPHLMGVYKEKGFPTMYQEENPYSGMFVYIDGMGFREAPSDYYPNFGGLGRPPLSPCATLQYFDDVVTLNEKMFAFLWLVNLSHDDLNGVGYLDRRLESMLRRHAASGIFENNALLVVSDHGLRAGSGYRLTDLGVYEDKLPLCLLALPRRFLHQYPEAAANLETNQRRLVTGYDLHATLLALSTLPRFHPRQTDRGLSLFQTVPPERTCADAYILPQFCACKDEKATVNDLLDVNSYLPFSVVDYVNDLLRTEFPGKCIVWKLAKSGPIKVRKVDPAKPYFFEFWFETEPQPVAKFYVHGWLKEKGGWSGRTVELLERIDTYRPGSRCLPDTLESKYCRCKPELLNSLQTTDFRPTKL